MKRPLPYFIGRITLSFVFCIILSYGSQSQHLIFGNEKTKWEAGVCFGPSFFLGDLGGNAGKGTRFIKDVNLQFTKMMKGAFITMYPNSIIGFRLSADYTFLEGDDAVIHTTGIDELWRKQRNLDFRTDIWEANACIELYPTMMFGRRSQEDAPRLRPYGLIGLGIFHFNPQGSLKDANGNKTWYNLQPLKLEGQGFAEYPNSKPYKLTQLNIPMGGGLKYFISDRFNLGVEFLYRKTFTDNIDDVSKNYIDPALFIKYLSPQEADLAIKLSDKSIGIIYPGMTRYEPGTQRGDTKQFDTYFSFVAKIGIQLGPVYENTFSRRAARQTRCPAVY